jgi:hypothetical protein
MKSLNSFIGSAATSTVRGTSTKQLQAESHSSKFKTIQIGFSHSYSPAIAMIFNLPFFALLYIAGAS